MAIIALGWGERPNKKGVTGRVTHGLTLDSELRPGALMCPWKIPVGGITSGLLPVTKAKLLRKLSPFARPNSAGRRSGFDRPVQFRMTGAHVQFRMTGAQIDQGQNGGKKELIDGRVLPLSQRGMCHCYHTTFSPSASSHASFSHQRRAGRYRR
jgi:hypothetical protein